MVIGVKYCGGCNPTYCRVSGVDQIKKQLCKCVFLPYKEGQEYDSVLVVCGCEVACVAMEKDLNMKCYLRNQNEINAALDVLKAISGQAKNDMRF